VLGPWISKHDATTMEVDSLDFVPEMHVIKHIFSGGDHCFAIVTQEVLMK
jgi:hypothetical protein